MTTFCELQSNTNTEIYPRQSRGVVSSLGDLSEKDSRWKDYKVQSLDVSKIYASDDRLDFQKRGERMNQCADTLIFKFTNPDANGECLLKLHHANSCHVPHCPLCQKRRSLLWFSKLSSAIATAELAYPSGRWLFLTLTHRNCSVDDLSNTMTNMNQAWQRLINRKEFKSVLGWVRTTEITRGSDNSAHPHFHAMLFVRPSYFSGKFYTSQSCWVELWRSCMRLDYSPNVDIRVVKPKAGFVSTAAAVAETAKYTVKLSDMTANKDWFLEMARQTTNKRMMSAGGVLKNALKDIETEKDLVHVGEDTDSMEIDENTPALVFKFNRVVADYFLYSNKQ